MTRVFWQSIKDKVINKQQLWQICPLGPLCVCGSCFPYAARLIFRLFQLIFPFLDLDIKYFDLGVLHRDATDDKVTVEAAEATLK